MRKATLLFAALGTLAMACGAPQKPVTFVSSATIESGVDVVSRTLATNGFSSPQVDRQAGIVSTEWKNTGFGYGQIQGAPATIVRRFIVVIAPAAQGSNVTVRIDAKRCTQLGFAIEGAEVRGQCEEVPMIPEQMQNEVDALGSKVQQALASAKGS